MSAAPATLATAFAAIAHARPAATALIAGARTVRYGELARCAAAVAARLGAAGVRVGDRVGLPAGRSVGHVAAMLGVWGHGATLVPLPAEPAARAAITVAHVVDVDLAGDATHDATAAGARLHAPSARSDVPALVLATSGSTGVAKGVVLDHAALLARLTALAAAMPYRADDIACHRTPPTFVDAYAELLGPLLAGAPVVVLPEPLAIDDLARAIEQAGVTRLLLVPSLLALLLEARPSLPAHLRLIATSGEPISAALVARARAASTARLVNIYGSTEVGGDASYADLGELADLVAGAPVAIGRPLAGAAMRIVDGELQVAGPMLARGYDGDPARTAARFVLDGGVRWFRTGDRARLDAAGRYVLEGRADDQVKIHGVRVELGEVEAPLRAMPGVTDAAAAVHDGRIVAAVVGALARIDPAALGLSSAATPRVIAVLPRIPTTPHGKRDRAALVDEIRAATRASDHAAPAPADELTALATSWFARLAGAPCGPEDDLAALGGDSMSRLELLVLVERAGWHLGHHDLPSPLTASGLAAVLRARPRMPAARIDALAATDDGTAFPVTDLQRVIVLDTLANRGTPMWLEQLAYTLPATVDPDRLEAAWRDELAAEAALRTRFTIVRREVLQRIEPATTAAPFALARIDARALDLAAYRLRVRSEEWTRISHDFDLATGPLFEVCLVSGRERCDLIFTYHHAILDGASARAVLRSVLARTAGAAVPGPAATPFRAWCEQPRPDPAPLRARLAGYVHREVVDPPAPTGDRAWRWFHAALGLRTWLARRRVRRSARRLPTGHTPAVYAGGDVTSQPLPQLLDQAIAARARELRVTPTALWALAFALHLARERATHDVVFGMLVSGRDGASATTVGMLASCLPLRVTLDHAATLAATARGVHAALAELDALARTPALDLGRDGLDPRAWLDTLLTSWRFPAAPPTAIPVSSGRGVTMHAPHTALLVSPREVAAGARAFHRTDRIRREVLAYLDALLAAPDDQPIAALRAIAVDEGGLVIGQPAL